MHLTCGNSSKLADRLLLVGYSLEAKCFVGNALLKQRGAFRILFCKSHALVKHVQHKTIGGEKLEVVVSPNIGTPAWNKVTAKLRGTTNAVVYVRSQDVGNVDHDQAIRYVTDIFTDNGKQGPKLFELKYFMSRQSQGVNDVNMYYGMSFDASIEAAKSLLAGIINSENAERQSSALNVLDDKQKLQSTASAPSDDVPCKALSTLTVGPPKTARKLDFSEEEQSKVTVQEGDKVLPELNNDDWALLAKALKHGKAASNHIRVNVVGNQGAGKTTLIKRLQQEPFTCAGLQANPTEALAISEVTLRCIQSGNEIEWESRPSGFARLLNKQRMAEAMSTVSKYFKDEGSAGNIVDQAEYEMHSASDEVLDDKTDRPTEEINYQNMAAQEERAQFLKDVMSEKERIHKRQIYVSFWDFAGQATYYSTHQAFISQNAVYIIVFDLSKDFDCELKDSLGFRSSLAGRCKVRDSILFWATSIKTFTVDHNGGRAPIIIVGTRGDRVSEEDATEKFNQIRMFTQLETVSCIRIDNTIDMDVKGTDIPADLEMLRTAILNQGLGIYDMMVDARWIDLGNILLQKATCGTQAMTFQQLLEMNNEIDVPLENKDTLRQFLDHMHCRGQLLYFPEHLDDDLILLRPSLLVDFLNKLMRTSNDTDQSTSNVDPKNANGIITELFTLQTARGILSANLQQNAKQLLRILSTLKIAFYYEGFGNLPVYIIPSLLPDMTSDNDTNQAVEKGPVLKVDFDDDPVPVGFYHLLLTAFVEQISSLQIHKKGNKPELYFRHATMYLDKKEVIVDMRWEGNRIYIEINNYSDKFSLCKMAIRDLTSRMQLAIQSTADVYRHYNVNYFLGVQCPDHSHSFQRIEDVETDGTLFCVKKRHTTRIASLAKTVECTQLEHAERETEKFLSQCPKDSHLCRLACRLPPEDDAKVLAAKLGLARVQALEDYTKSDVQRLHVLLKWRQSNMKKTLQQLLSKLCKSNDYDLPFLEKIVKSVVKLNEYTGLPGDVLDGTLDPKIISIVASFVGLAYPLLMAELGVPSNRVETTRGDFPNNNSVTVHSLLHLWKQQQPLDANLRLLLSTMDHLGINTSQLVVIIARGFDTA